MKNIIDSIQARLKNYSKAANKNHQLTLTRYFQERLLFRLSQSEYKNSFYLKGGALIYALEKEASRPTLDLDLLARKINANHNEIKRIFKAVCSIEHLEDGVSFDIARIDTIEIVKEGRYSGIRVKIPASLGKINQRLQVDIGFGDTIVPGPVEMKYPTLLEMAVPSILAYSVESMVAEKFQAMIDLSELNSRMKDFYDLYKILGSGDYRKDVLKEAVYATFQKRKTALEKNHPLFTSQFASDEMRNAQWKSFLNKASLNTSIAFPEVMKLIKENLEPIYEGLQT